MKKLITAIVCLGFLTGCPNKEEVKDMMESLTAKRTEAIKLLSAQDYSLEGLLKTQEYFFDFSERVHLMKVDEDALKNIQRLIKNTGAKAFCEAFVVPTSYWTPLEDYCAKGTFYKCSPEIKEYKNSLQLLKELAGPENSATLNQESVCN